MSIVEYNWNMFCKTGKIEYFIKYKNEEINRQKAEAQVVYDNKNERDCIKTS